MTSFHPRYFALGPHYFAKHAPNSKMIALRIVKWTIAWKDNCFKEPTHLSERVGDEIPGVVVYLSFHAWVGWVSEIKMD